MAELEPLRNHDSTHLTTKAASDPAERKESLARLWENEARLAQTEAERVLFKWDNVFNSLPTPRPTPAPLPATLRPTGPNGVTNPPAPTVTPGGVVTSSPTPNTCLVGTTRDAYLLEQLSQITSAMLLTNPSTPQGRSFTFMINDPLQPDVCVYPTLEQRFALVSFYYSTNGEGWVDDARWLSASEECTWTGVTCQGDTAVTSVELGT